MGGTGCHDGPRRARGPRGAHVQAMGPRQPHRLADRDRPEEARARALRVHWYRIKRTYQKPHGGFLAIGPRYPGVLSDDDMVVLSVPMFYKWFDHALIMGVPRAPARGLSLSLGAASL